MKLKTFIWFSSVGLSLMAFSTINQSMLDGVNPKSGQYYLRVSLPFLLGFVPMAITLGTLWMSTFFHLLVKDEQSREVILQRVGFFIIQE